MTTTLAGVSSPAAGQTRPGEAVLRTRGLSKLYGSRLAVSNLDLEVRRGEIFGFLGPNGAGKTTTIRMLLGLIAPSHGSIELLGQDLLSQRARLLPRVGALIETPALYLAMTGRDNLRAVGATLGGVSEERIQALLSTVGLADRQRDRVRTYSLGMKQRLGVALALLSDPELLILDEPANGLDPAGIAEMRDLLRQLAAGGKTIFISSHVLGEVRQICDRVAIINLGKLVTVSTVADLVSGHGELSVGVERPAETLEVIRRQPWGTSARLEGEILITPAPNGRGRDLVAFLVQAGFVPDSVSPRTQDLEEVFLSLTGNSHQVNGGAA